MHSIHHYVCTILISFTSVNIHQHQKHNLQQTDGDDSQKILHIMRQFYCLVCDKMNDLKTGRFMENTIYCKTCSQSTCMVHIPGLYPDKFGEKKEQNWDKWSLGDRINASGKCCKGDDVSQVNNN